MPNQHIENNNNNFFSVDGSFSETFLNFESQELLTEELLNSKIKHEIYGMSEKLSPHYYEGSHVTSEFRAFKKTEKGKKTISQIEKELKVCFQKLSEWSKTHDLEVMIDVEDEHTGQQIATRQGIGDELLFFYDRLIKGDFSDKIIVFYADGKKAIETLSLLIQDLSIDLVFRQNELVNLAADGNLRMCADGCFSRFTTAADALKNYGNLAIPILKKKFIRSLAEEIAKRPMARAVGLTMNYMQSICFVIEIDPHGNEIHAENFLINTLLKKLNLETFAIKDEIVDHLFIPFQSKRKDYLFQQFFREFITEFTVKRFIQFIKHEYYQSKNIEFISGEFKVPKEMDVSEDLKVIGKDPEFGGAEVLSWEEGKGTVLKEENALAITLTERLYDKNVLDATHKRWHLKFTLLREFFTQNDITFFPVTSKTYTQNFRIIPGNIELTWLKNEENNRVLLLECLEHIPNCFDILKGLVPNTLVESLFINVNDLIQFFTKLPTEQHIDALTWMKQNKVVFEGVLLNERLFNELNKLNHEDIVFDKSYYMKNYNILFSKLSTEALFELIKQLPPQLINHLLTEYIDLLNKSKFILSWQKTPAIIDFMRFLVKGGFKDFPSLIFKKNFHRWDQQQEDYVTFLKDIDFSYSNFEKIESHASFADLNFEGSRLKNCIIFNNIVGVNFKKANGNINIFGDVDQVDFSDSYLDIYIEGKVKNSYFQKLSGNILIFGDFHESTASDLKGKFKLNGNVKEADLQNFDGKIEINGALDKVNFKNAQGKSLAINGEIKNCDLHGIQFEKIEVNGKITNSYLTSIDFRNTIFADPQTNFSTNSDKVFKVEFQFYKEENDIFKSFFHDSQFSTTSLIQLLNLPCINRFTMSNRDFFLLRGTKLNEVDFLNKDLRTLLKRFYLIDFKGANLQFAKFDYFLQNEIPFFYQLKFKNADLQGASFVKTNLVNAIFDGANLSNCDLSTADTEDMGVRGATINNLQLRSDQLFSFYEQGHRDFSTLRLVGNLENVKPFSLAGAKLSLQAFKHLKEQGFNNFKGVDLAAVSHEIEIYRSRDSSPFEENALHAQETLASTLNICLKKKSPKRKREIQCLFDEDDVKQFTIQNEESGETEIDSERFIDKLKSAPENQREQLIEFASQYPIVGTKKNEGKKLIQLRKWQGHFTKVHQVSNLILKGVIGKNILISFLNGNYEDTAINLGLLGGGSFLGQFSQKLETMGDAFLLERKTLLGNGFKAASPFFKRGTSAFMVYDLVQAVKELNSNDTASLVRVVGDGIYIGVDIAEIGIETAEVFGLFEGVSAITGPIGEAIGAVVFLGTDIYQAVHCVKQIDAMLPLTGGEKFREGVRAFLGMSIEGYLEDLIHEKQFYEEVIKQKSKLLREYSMIKNYFFPTEKQVCRKVSYLQADSYGGGLNGGGSLDGSYWRLAKSCDQTETDLDNQIFLDGPKEQRTFSRAKPTMPESGDLLCFPSGTGGSTDLSYSCKNAIGIGDLNSKDGNYTLINVGEGEDRVRGFIETPNIIVAGNGDKHLIGGNQNDIFFLQGDLTSGYVDGEGGINILDLGDFAS
ncbi:pentapeptide repeat-containing protein, partial [Legionella sp.]|uniref:pentapeptide repeat-containing protein n=1 Tax=Legionella sp. TaxID=459 RepID=UPI003C800EA2